MERGQRKCQRNVKCPQAVQFISPSEMFSPGKRVPARLECAGPRPHLLMTLKKKKKTVLKWFEWRKIKERLNGVSKHRLYEVLMDRMLQVVKRTEWAEGG